MAHDDVLAQVTELLLDQVILTTQSITLHFYDEVTEANLKATQRAIQSSSICFDPLIGNALVDEHSRPAKRLVLDQLMATARKKRKLILFAQLIEMDNGSKFLGLNDARGGRRWVWVNKHDELLSTLSDALITLCTFEQKKLC